MSAGQVLYECCTRMLQMVSLVEPNRAQMSLENCWRALDSSALFDEKMALKNLQNRENRKTCYQIFLALSHEPVDLQIPTILHFNH